MPFALILSSPAEHFERLADFVLIGRRMSSPLRFDGRVVLVTGAGGGKWWITVTVDHPEVSLHVCLIANRLQRDLCSFLVLLFAFLLKDEDI